MTDSIYKMRKVLAVKISEGAVMDWVIGKILEKDIRLTQSFAAKTDGSHEAGLACWDENLHHPWSPSTSWSQGGHLIDKFKIWLSPPTDGCDEPNGWDAEIYDDDGNEVIGHAIGCVSALEAVCKSVIFAKCDRTVDVPVDLWSETK